MNKLCVCSSKEGLGEEEDGWAFSLCGKPTNPVQTCVLCGLMTSQRFYIHLLLYVVGFVIVLH